MLFRLEKRVTDPKTGKVIQYQAVETPSLETAISNFMRQFGGPNGLEHALDQNSTWQHGNATYILSDENGPLIPDPDKQFADIHGFTPDWREVKER